MTYAVHDFAAINRRLNRKQEPVAAVAEPAGIVGALMATRENNVAALRAEVKQMERDLAAYAEHDPVEIF